VLVISPSQRIDEIAARHQHELPTTIRALLASIGVQGHGRQASGSALVSYLLFVNGYLNELMALGRADTLARQQEVLDFFHDGGSGRTLGQPLGADFDNS
jgi:NTE family protein